MYDKHDDTGTTQLGYIRDGRYVSSGTDYGAWVDYSTKIGKFLYVQGTLNYHGTKPYFVTVLTVKQCRLMGRRNISEYLCAMESQQGGKSVAGKRILY